MIPDKDAIQALGNTDATKALIVGNDVYDPLLFQPRLVRFTRKQYLFLNKYRLGTPLREAAKEAELSGEQAERFLDKPETVAWLQDRALKDHIKNEWQEPGKWWALGDEVLEGKRHLSKDQQIVYMAFGDRICPKTKATEDSRPQITININPEAVKKAQERQASIDAEIVERKAS